MRIELTYMTLKRGLRRHSLTLQVVILCKRNTTPKPVPLWEQTHRHTRGAGARTQVQVAERNVRLATRVRSPTSPFG